MRSSIRRDVEKASRQGGWWGEDYERHQVKALFGRNSPIQLAHMQRYCDDYGKPADDVP